MSDVETGITATEFKEWHRSKVTKYVVGQLEAIRANKTAMVMSGATLAPDAGDNATQYNIGYVAGMAAFLDMQYDDDSTPVSSYEH